MHINLQIVFFLLFSIREILSFAWFLLNTHTHTLKIRIWRISLSQKLSKAWIIEGHLTSLIHIRWNQFEWTFNFLTSSSTSSDTEWAACIVVLYLVQIRAEIRKKPSIFNVRYSGQLTLNSFFDSVHALSLYTLRAEFVRLHTDTHTHTHCIDAEECRKMEYPSVSLFYISFVCMHTELLKMALMLQFDGVFIHAWCYLKESDAQTV